MTQLFADPVYKVGGSTQSGQAAFGIGTAFKRGTVNGTVASNAAVNDKAIGVSFASGLGYAAVGAETVSLTRVGKAFVQTGGVFSDGAYLVANASGLMIDQSGLDADFAFKNIIGQAYQASTAANQAVISELMFQLVKNEDRIVVSSGGTVTDGIIALYPGRFKMKVLKAYVLADSDIAANDTNYCNFSLFNRDDDGSGTTEITTNVDANTTKATGGSALTGKVLFELTLTTTAASLVITRDQVLELRTDQGGTGPNLVNGRLVLDVEYLFE